MTKSSAFAKGMLAAGAGLAALASAAAASAQPYGGPGYSNYDPCRREANGRGVTGAIVGGGAGAVIGSQMAASGHRSDGSLLGGVLGAIAGAAIGHSSAACANAPPPPPPSADAAPPPPPPPPAAYGDYPPPPSSAAYDGPPPPRYAEREAVWVYGRHGVRYRVVDENFDRDGCTLAESPVYLPDGRIDRRFVRVCPDYRGRYHVVD
jgi:opacity protein-like surface antigen